MDTQEFKEKVKILTNDEYEVLGEYKNCDTPIKMKHKVCGYVWDTTTPYCFTKKNKPNRCPKCSKQHRGKISRLSFEKFQERILENNKNKFDIISDFNGGCNPITLCCKSCNNNFNIKKASRLLFENVLCPNCEKPKYHGANSTEWFKARMKEICNDEYELIGEFTGVNNYVTLKHNICGNIYNSTIGSSFLSGTRCPYCNISKGEKRIQDFLNENKIKYIYQKSFSDLYNQKKRHLLSYDFFLPTHNLLIEYQGEQHDHPIKYSNNMTDEIAEKRYEKQKINDNKKLLYAKEHNIKLLEIWYWDFNNIEKILRRTLNV